MRSPLPLLLTAALAPGLSALLLAGCPSNNTPSSSSAGSGGASTTSSSGRPTTTSGSGSSTTSGSGSSTTSGSGSSTTSSSGGQDAGPLPLPDGGIANPCMLPGSVLFTSTGKSTMPGGSPSWPDLTFLNLPAGFCAHYYGTVPNARQIRFAPGGELFVASPSAPSTGGGPGGLNAFVVLPDDNLDGVGDTPITFLSFGASAMNQGMLFTPGFFYYQDGTPPGTKIMRMPYATGDRKPSGAGAQVADITVYTSNVHWPKTMDIADDGTIYVGNGGDQTESCVTPHPFHGGILKIDPAPGGSNPNGVQVSQGFRNPIAVRCQRGHNHCFALELAKDYSYGQGGREKLVPIRQGDDWGFPCCATQNLPYPGSPAGTNCSAVTSDTNGFYIGDTPFGVDFEPGYWPSPWTRQVFVALHGSCCGVFQGARIVAIPTDANGMPTPSNNLTNEGTNTGMVDFVTGWYDTKAMVQTGNGRPAAVTFSPDGRLFVANDNNGVIFWIAPIQ